MGNGYFIFFVYHDPQVVTGGRRRSKGTQDTRHSLVTCNVVEISVKDFDDSLFTAVASYLALRVNESDAKKMARVMAPSDKIALYADRIKQTEKYRAWYLTEGMKVPVNTKLSKLKP